MLRRKRPKKPPGSLLDAIEEEVANARSNTSTGAIPIETNVRRKRIEAIQEQVMRAARKPRTLVLLVLLLAAVLELAAVKWTTDASEAIEHQHVDALGNDPSEQTAVRGHEEHARLAALADGSVGGDASARADGGVIADGGMTGDGGTSADGGTNADGGVSADGGVVADAGVVGDAGQATLKVPVSPPASAL
jgi:hypothetical protein